MRHGGRRKGAGRPHGAINKITEEARAFAQANLDFTLEGIKRLAEKAESENVQFNSLREILHTAVGRPRLMEAPPEPPKPAIKIYRWAENESEAMPDPARRKAEKKESKS